MQDILAGGILVSASPWQRTFPRKQPTRTFHRTKQGRAGTTTPYKITVQPGQLHSPLLKFGFPSLAVH